MGTEAKSAAPRSGTGRLLSIDALRGFDMFWIIGGEDIFKALADWANWPFKDKVHEQLTHADWEGFRFYDLIFPLFLFLVGVVLPFSLGKMREQGESTGALFGRIFRRTVLLFFLGLLYNHLLQFNFNELRVAGVLQRIALCYFFAALVTMCSGVRIQAVLTVALLVGYWAILTFVSAPGVKAGDYSKEGNLAGYVDRNYLPGKIYDAYYKYGDNEGLLSTMPAVATALMGVLAGHWLRSPRSPGRKVLGLILAGLVCLGAGYAWNFQFPIIKNIWTSSFALVAAGWSLLLLALFYGIIDGLGIRFWSFFFVVIGANAITIYILPHIIDFKKVADFFLGGVIHHADDWISRGLGIYRPGFGVPAEEIAIVVVEWVFLLILYRNRLFLRV